MLHFPCRLGFISRVFPSIAGYPALAGNIHPVCRVERDFDITAVFQFDYDSIASLGNFDFHDAECDLSRGGGLVDQEPVKG